jgi:hypothetical protein
MHLFYTGFFLILVRSFYGLQYFYKSFRVLFNLKFGLLVRCCFLNNLILSFNHWILVLFPVLHSFHYHRDGCFQIRIWRALCRREPWQNSIWIVRIGQGKRWHRRIIVHIASRRSSICRISRTLIIIGWVFKSKFLKGWRLAKWLICRTNSSSWKNKRL